MIHSPGSATVASSGSVSVTVQRVPSERSTVARRDADARPSLHRQASRTWPSSEISSSSPAHGTAAGSMPGAVFTTRSAPAYTDVNSSNAGMKSRGRQVRLPATSRRAGSATTTQSLVTGASASARASSGSTASTEQLWEAIASRTASRSEPTQRLADLASHTRSAPIEHVTSCTSLPARR